MNRSPKKTKASTVQADAERFKELLNMPIARGSAEERELLEIIERYLREALRPGLIKKFGWRVANAKVDSSVRYTEMINGFFEKCLVQGVNWNAQFETAAKLKAWSSRVITNMMIDYFKRKKFETVMDHDAIDALAEQRADYFESKTDIRFDALLETLVAWHDGHDEKLQVYAGVLELHYVIGRGRREIAEELQLGESTVSKYRNEAVERLKEEMERRQLS